MDLVRIFIFNLCLIALTSCGKNAQALQEEGILKAQNYLSSKNCPEALKALEEITYDHSDARFLKTLSSSYACFANYSTIVFFAQDIEKTSLPAPIGGMTTYSTSLSEIEESIENNPSYEYLAKAVDTLLFAGGIDPEANPTKALRATHFGPSVLGDLHNQLAFMMMVELGKFMKIYGNTNDIGQKGQRVGTIESVCFTNYSNTSPLVQAYLNSGVTGICSLGEEGHPDLEIGSPNRKEKMCRGVIVMNNLIELLPEVIAASGGGQVDVLKDFIEKIETIKDDFLAIEPAMEETLNVKGQKNCVADPAITFATLEAAFVAYFETMVQ